MNTLFEHPVQLLAGPPLPLLPDTEPGTAAPEVVESIIRVAGTFCIAQRVMMDGHDVQRIAADVHRSPADVRAALLHMVNALIVAAAAPEDEAVEVSRIVASAYATAHAPGTMV